METVTVSPKFQVIISRSVRDALDIHPGEKIQVLQYKDRIELVPLKDIKKMRGFLKGVDTTVLREKDRA